MEREKNPSLPWHRLIYGLFAGWHRKQLIRQLFGFFLWSAASAELQCCVIFHSRFLAIHLTLISLFLLKIQINLNEIQRFPCFVAKHFRQLFTRHYAGGVKTLQSEKLQINTQIAGWYSRRCRGKADVKDCCFMSHKRRSREHGNYGSAGYARRA